MYFKFHSLFPVDLCLKQANHKKNVWNFVSPCQQVVSTVMLKQARNAKQVWIIRSTFKYYVWILFGNHRYCVRYNPRYEYLSLMKSHRKHTFIKRLNNIKQSTHALLVSRTPRVYTTRGAFSAYARSGQNRPLWCQLPTPG